MAVRPVRVAALRDEYAVVDQVLVLIRIPVRVPSLDMGRLHHRQVTLGTESIDTESIS